MHLFSQRSGLTSFFILFFVLLWHESAAQNPIVASSQQYYLEQIQRLLPPNEHWEKWLKETGELPPDFDLLPSIPYLPDPMLFNSGQPLQNPGQWPQRRQELLKLFQRLIYGSMPPSPDKVRVFELKEQLEAGVKIRTVTLSFGPEPGAKAYLELLIPPGAGPFPVFMTQDIHRSWAMIALTRGYIGCVYSTVESDKETEASLELWPGFDWTKLTRQAWKASRCLDYLNTLPIVDRSRVAIAGHLQNGKVSLIASAFDDRFTAVISSSSGVGGACPFRLFSEAYFGEGIELITRNFPEWLHPRLRFFAGRENKLPIDQHELLACIAPRACLISTAQNDAVESVWAMEQVYYAAQKVYSFLGVPNALNLRSRPGEHSTRPEDIESYMDWLDTRFGRKGFVSANQPIYPTYNDWLKNSGEKINPASFPAIGMQGLLTSGSGNPILSKEQWQLKRDEITQRILWGLGDAPPAASSMGSLFGAESFYTAVLMDRHQTPPEIEKLRGSFGNYIAGDLYYPSSTAKSGQKLPAVIWLHPTAPAHGYQAGFHRGPPMHIALALRGFAVFAFDQIGHGNRLDEAQKFYQRYPHWSLMGKTVVDTRAAVNALSSFAFIDQSRIYVLGYGTGGIAALHTAALDERIAGVISVAGFNPMRLDTLNKGTGGIERWSRWIPLLPRLGAFVGNEARVPYDFHEVIASIAPRPVLIVTPRFDYQANPSDLTLSLAESRKVYDFLGASKHFGFLLVDDYNRFGPEMQNLVFDQIHKIASGSY